LHKNDGPLSIFLVGDPNDPFQTLEQFRAQLVVLFFMDVIIIISWCIRMQHNDLIFKNLYSRPDNYRGHFKKEFALVILRARVRHKANMSVWLEALL
jgi:hypothetical protein